MLAVQVELLTGRYVATRYNDRNRVEWPPHPARLFSAAVAAWADVDEPDPTERAALSWWEACGAPEIACSWGEDWSERSPVVHFVPINDTQVVGRDVSETYRRLRLTREAEWAGHADSAKSRARLTRDREKLEAKASEDSLRVASGGGAPASAMQILPETRSRQARVYPTAVPAEDIVTFSWPDCDGAAAEVSVLDGVLRRIARLGHSSSLVSVQVVKNSRIAALVPDERGRIQIRVSSPGQVDALERSFVRHQATEPRSLPAASATYREAGETRPDAPRTAFDEDWILLDPGQHFIIRDTLGLTRAVRGALLAWTDQQPAPEVLSGHASDSGTDQTVPTRHAHLALAALPFVGYPHADGSIQGIALILPRHPTSENRDTVLIAASRWLDEGGGALRLGRRGSTVVSRVVPEDAPYSARPERWCRASKRWTSVTPVALDRNPGQLDHHVPERRAAALAEAEATIRAACLHIGLPEPRQVSVRSDPPILGTRPVRTFPPYAVQEGRLRRLLVHVQLDFDEDVRGPVILGAGRYLGYGLCAPIADRPGGDPS